MGKKAFTLLELLIVVSILLIIGTAVLVLLNPWQQLGKARDARRKADLATLRKVLEDYYNDKGCYPKPEEICYDDSTNNPINNICEGSGVSRKIIKKTCYICGNEDAPLNFDKLSPYINKLPCDPEHARVRYQYSVETTGCPNGSCSAGCTNYCAAKYRIYSDLYLADETLGCGVGGCGPPPYGYDYGVTSPNANLEIAPGWECFTTVAPCTCKYCGINYFLCRDDREAYPECTNPNDIYPAGLCLIANPTGTPCK